MKILHSYLAFQATFSACEMGEFPNLHLTAQLSAISKNIKTGIKGQKILVKLARNPSITGGGNWAGLTAVIPGVSPKLCLSDLFGALRFLGGQLTQLPRYV
jgi:hypothetical protein